MSLLEVLCERRTERKGGFRRDMYASSGKVADIRGARDGAWAVHLQGVPGPASSLLHPLHGSFASSVSIAASIQFMWSAPIQRMATGSHQDAWDSMRNHQPLRVEPPP
jgi:hypothetical protein